jgi:hypothetical protein
VFPSGSSVTRRPPWLLAGFRGSVSLLSSATMETLRLPLSVSKASLRSALDTFSCLACLLTPAAKSPPVCQVVIKCQCPPLFWPLRKGDRRLSQVSREPFRTFALLLDPGRTIALGILALWYCSRRHKDESSSYLFNISRLDRTAFALAVYA